jgi:alpha-L-rhamnosidase
MAKLKVEALTCEYRTNPLGIGVKVPRFSWQIASDVRGTLQKGYQIVVKAEEGTVVWDSRYTETEQSIQVPYAGPELQSLTRYMYKVKVWDTAGQESEWSDAAWFEMGVLDQTEWKAQWITPSSE